MDLQDDKLTRSIKGDTPEDRLPTYGEADPRTPEQIAGEAEEARLSTLHSKLLSFYRQELSRQEMNRFEQALDEDYYDGIQLTDEELQVLNDRGQPPTVYNVLAQTINWICGTEKRSRTDFKILPRGKEDSQPAERKTKYMKYLTDVNRFTFHRSYAFEHCVKVGVGWLECGLQDDDDGEPIFERSESWRNVLWDSAGGRMQDDWRYLFKTRFVDADVASAMFADIPGAQDKIERSVANTAVMGGIDGLDGDLAMDQAESEMDESGLGSGALNEHTRRRVRMIQAEYRTPERVTRMRGGPFNGQVFDQQDPRHVEMVQTGRAATAEKMMMRVRLAIFTPTEILMDIPSPYRHNKFSLTPVWGNLRGRNGLPYGVIRNLRPIQDGVNKRASKALHILSTNKTIIEEGALSSEQSMDDFESEVARPDGIIVMATGKMDKIKLDVDRGMDQAHMEMMSHDVGMIQQVGGVTDESMGRTTNATSGKAIQARQDQGSLATSNYFDNLRLANQMHGEKSLSLVEQFVTDEKQFRVTNMRGAPEFVGMNDGLPENDITRSAADFVISEADWRATLRQAATDQLMEMAQKLPPDLLVGILDLIVDQMDIVNRDEIVKRIRAMSGQKDPDQTEPTPEDMQAEQAKKAQQAQQQRHDELQMQLLEATAADKKASAEQKAAQVDVARSVMLNNNMTAASSAMTAATAVITMPTIAKVADGLLMQGGWKAGIPVPTNLGAPAMNGMPMPPAPPGPAPIPQPAPAAPPAMPVQ